MLARTDGATPVAPALELTSSQHLPSAAPPRGDVIELQVSGSQAGAAAEVQRVVAWLGREHLGVEPLRQLIRGPLP